MSRWRALVPRFAIPTGNVEVGVLPGVAVREDHGAAVGGNSRRVIVGASIRAGRAMVVVLPRAPGATGRFRWVGG